MVQNLGRCGWYPLSVRARASRALGWYGWCAFLLGLIWCGIPSTLQARAGDPPPSRQHVLRPLAALPVQALPAVDVSALLAKDAQSASREPMQFAMPLAVAFHPAQHGSWETLPNGDRVWRLRVHVPGAMSLNFGFTSYDLPPGATLHIVPEDGTAYEGPYTAQDNKAHAQLWTPPVPGEHAVLELYVPAAAPAEPQLTLTQVGAGYRDVLHLAAPPKNHGLCNIDVICAQGDAWRNQIRSVGLYTISGTTACTGTLLIDVPRSFRPFFLTANHCGVNTANAPSVVVFWNFEATTCGSQSGVPTDTQSGATFRAAEAAVDVALLELDARPDPIFNVFYAGWDRSGSAPRGSVGIHHPRGDVKSISINTDPLTTGDNCLDPQLGVNTHWIVNNWEEGTTEQGSSGSGLWDPATGLLVGFLSGGEASCSNRRGADCYGKFSVAWNRGSTAASRLRDWLDPNNQGVLQVTGTNPPGGGGGTGPDDHGQTEATATPLGSNETRTGILSSGEDADVFRIDLASAGTLTVETTGTTDTLGALFTSLAGCATNSSILAGGARQCTTAPLLNDNDTGEGLNFRFSRALNAGTYFVVVETAFVNARGSYSIRTSFTTGQPPPPAPQPPPPAPQSPPPVVNTAEDEGGGGCTLNPTAPGDPLLLSFYVALGLYAAWQQLRRRR